MSSISAVITAHREGILAGPTINSLIEAAEEAERAGHSIERIAVLDRPDAATVEMFSTANLKGFAVHQLDLGDQGLARNAAVKLASGQFLAFLDGDDLWSYNWLTRAYDECIADPDNVIVHPEMNVFFENQHGLLLKPDMRSPHFNPEGLRVVNYYDALCFADRHIYERFPYAGRDISGGFAYEDWQWACETLAAGLLHYVAPGTIHFKRRRKASQNAEASGRGVIHRPTPLSFYSWYPNEHQRDER